MALSVRAHADLTTQDMSDSRGAPSMSGEERDRGIGFGYLGCRPEVVPFHRAAGWTQIQARETHLSRTDAGTVIHNGPGPDSPILICGLGRDVSDWPHGDIALRGTPW